MIKIGIKNGQPHLMVDEDLSLSNDDLAKMCACLDTGVYTKLLLGLLAEYYNDEDIYALQNRISFYKQSKIFMSTSVVEDAKIPYIKKARGIIDDSKLM